MPAYSNGKQDLDPHFLASRWHDGDDIAVPHGYMASLSLRYSKPLVLKIFYHLIA